MINLTPKSISPPAQPIGSELNQAKQATTSNNAVASSVIKQPDSSNVVSRDSAVQSIDKATVQVAVDKMNSLVQNIQRDLSFSVDDESGLTVIKVIDSQSGQLIRQIPSEEVIAIANVLNDIKAGDDSDVLKERGLLFSNNA
jgi:flagellar protein FlaG